MYIQIKINIMCEKCELESNGLRSGKGSAIISKMMGIGRCKHNEGCSCEKCEKYRHQNPYEGNLFQKLGF